MKRQIVINDRMQQGYIYYRTEPVGRNFAPEFEPQLTPKQMLALGVFGGKYMTDCRDEFPATWFARARLCAERHHPRLNYFGVNASQSVNCRSAVRSEFHGLPISRLQNISKTLVITRGPERTGVHITHHRKCALNQSLTPKLARHQQVRNSH